MTELTMDLTHDTICSIARANTALFLRSGTLTKQPAPTDSRFRHLAFVLSNSANPQVPPDWPIPTFPSYWD